MGALREAVQKEVTRLQAEMQKVDRAIAPALLRKRKYEEQIQPLLHYLKTLGESADEETQTTLPSITHTRTIKAKQPLTHVAYDAIKRIGHKVHLKDLMAEIERGGSYKIPGKDAKRNLQTALWRDKRVVYHREGIYGLAEWP